ncbi:MAG: hypothetical protein ACI9HK_002342 [Pirellulaceae bacterium]|jgi:hypothetical protein
MDFEMKSLMTFRQRSTSKLVFAWLMSMLVCLCTFSLVMPPQITTLISPGSTESECPSEEEGKTSEREIVLSSSRGRRSAKRLDGPHCHVSTVGRRLKIASAFRALSAVDGHRLANGLAAPRLI